MSKLEVQSVIQQLGMQAHPEGGWYLETWRSNRAVRSDAFEGARSAGTAILYLLGDGAFSAFHRLRSDEVWHHYCGAPVELHRIAPSGAHECSLLGCDHRKNRPPNCVRQPLPRRHHPLQIAVR